MKGEGDGDRREGGDRRGRGGLGQERGSSLCDKHSQSNGIAQQ